VVCAESADEAALVLGPDEGHRAPQLQQPGASTPPASSSRVLSDARRCARPGMPTWTACAHASRPCAAHCTAALGAQHARAATSATSSRQRGMFSYTGLTDGAGEQEQYVTVQLVSFVLLTSTKMSSPTRPQ
jgi:hypothetical protein